MEDRKSPLPLPAKRALDKLSADIRDARRRRRIPMALMAQRAGIGRMTNRKMNLLRKEEPMQTVTVLIIVCWILLSIPVGVAICLFINAGKRK